MPAQLNEIIALCDEILEPDAFRDYCLNGLQVPRVPGAGTIERIVTGVSANARLFELAAAEEADLILVHHGLFWGSGVRALDSILRRRLQLLFDADTALAAYHLPLDGHPEIGNNALMAAAIGAASQAPFGIGYGRPIGVLAKLPGDGLEPAELATKLDGLTGKPPIALGNGPGAIRQIAIVSGAGTEHLQEAAQAGAEAFLTGEPNERATALATELGIHLFAAGHHDTEILGIRRLGEVLAESLDVEALFLDVPNPI